MQRYNLGRQEDGDAAGAKLPLKSRNPVDFKVKQGCMLLKDDGTDLAWHCEEHACSCQGGGVHCDE